MEAVDVITFGSPCQDLSVAGKRAGMKHEANGDEETTRSGLFMEAVRIIREMREATNGEKPRFAVWENVPGAFSSNKGEDFRVVLEELARIADEAAVIPVPPKGKWTTAGSILGDGYSLAWRVLDAQYHGVPQRRRRIFLVADFAGQCAEEILFECQSLHGNPPQSGQAWQTAAADSASCAGADDSEERGVNSLSPWDSQGNQVHDGTGKHVFPCLRGNGGGGYQQGYVLQGSGQNGDVVGSLCARDHKGVGSQYVDEGKCVIESVRKLDNESRNQRQQELCSSQGFCTSSQLASGKKVMGCLTATNYSKLGAQVMFSGDYTVVEEHKSYWDGGQVCGTLTANNAGGNQRMPDKDNFNCVIEQSEVCP